MPWVKFELLGFRTPTWGVGSLFFLDFQSVSVCYNPEPESGSREAWRPQTQHHPLSVWIHVPVIISFTENIDLFTPKLVLFSVPFSPDHCKKMMFPARRRLGIQ